MAFKKATKFAAKARLAIAGPSGAGKTFTALTLAFGLAENARVAVIDTERGSASKYADVFPEYDVNELETFHPDNFITAIHEAEQGGYEVLIIDSLSHAWNGQGGVLEVVDATAKRSQSKNTFNAWSEGTKIQNALIDAIVRSKLHVIVTMRSKTEYVIELVNGRNTPRKVGMAPVQRADLEYEFDCFFEMDYNNTLIVQKSRCSALANQVIDKPDASVADVLKSWLEGTPVPMPTPSMVDHACAEWAKAYKIPGNEIETRWEKFKVYILGVAISDPDLSQRHLDTLMRVINQQLAKAS